MTFCPFCGVRADVDLRQINFRDLGDHASMACPSCATPLGVIEFDTEPKMQIERCTACLGMFFNPGEMETLLAAQTNPLVWLDSEKINQINTDFGYDSEVVYRKCPMCSELMNRVNFAGKSGVIIDRCGFHGVWLGGSKLRRLTEWWRAGGKLVYQQNEASKAKLLYGKNPPPPTHGSITSPEKPVSDTWCSPDSNITPGILIDVVASVASMIFED